MLNDAEEVALRADVQHWKNRCAEAQADLINYQDRSRQELAGAEVAILRNYALEMCPVLDSLDQVYRDVMKDQYDLGTLRQAVLVFSEAVWNILRVRGLERMEALGKPYDPALHEAVNTRLSGLAPYVQVLEEVRPGYLWGGKVLRPAQVIISRMT